MGIGLPTASVGILSQSVDPRVAIALVVFPMMVSNAWQVFRAGQALRAARDYWIFAAALMPAIWLTTSVTARVSEATLIALLGGVVVVFAVVSLAATPPPLPDRYDRLAQGACGVLAGVLGGLTAIWAPPMVVYLLARRIDKEEFVRATGLLILLGSLPLCVGFWREGLLTGDLALLSGAMILPTLAGFSLGEVLRRRLPTARFRTLVLVVFLVMGLNLLRRALL